MRVEGAPRPLHIERVTRRRAAPESATTIANLTGGTLSGSGVSIAADGGQGFPFSPSVVSDAGNIFITGNGASVTGTVSGGTVGGSGIAIGGSSVALSTGGAGSITIPSVPTK